MELFKLVKTASNRKDEQGRPYTDVYLVYVNEEDSKKKKDKAIIVSAVRVRYVFRPDRVRFFGLAEHVENIDEYLATLTKQAPTL